VRKGEAQSIMQITDVRLRLIPDDNKLKAIASVTFDDEFVVHDIKIINGQNGQFIAMPSRKIGENEYRDIAHPLTIETRNSIKDAIFTKYDEVLSSGSEKL
jgi:stage V sporulation protein G